MGLDESQRSDGLLAGTSESFDRLEGRRVVAVIALPSLGTKLVGTHAGTDGDVKHEAGGTGHLVGGTLVAEVELLAFVGVLVVENAVGSGTSGIDAFLRLLHKFTSSTVYAVGEDATLLVALAVVKEETVLTKLGAGHVVFANVVEIALFGVGEEAVGLRALEVEVGAFEGEIVLRPDNAHQT